MPLHDIRRFVPLVLPFAVVAAAWALFIGPASSAAARDAARLEDLRERLAAPHERAEASGGVRLDADPAALFERQVSSADATAELLASLTRLALDAGATNLFIDSTAAPLPVTDNRGPGAADADEADPRVALFGMPLQYSPLPMSFEAGYTALGEFLWRLRDLPALVEIRGLTVKPGESREDDGGMERARASHDGRVSASLVLFVYSRRDAGVSPAVLEGGRR